MQTTKRDSEFYGDNENETALDIDFYSEDVPSFVHHPSPPIYEDITYFGSQTLPSGRGESREGRKGLVNNSTLMQIDGCIPAVSADE